MGTQANGEVSRKGSSQQVSASERRKRLPRVRTQSCVRMVPNETPPSSPTKSGGPEKGSRCSRITDVSFCFIREAPKMACPFPPILTGGRKGPLENEPYVKPPPSVSTVNVGDLVLPVLWLCDSRAQMIVHKIKAWPDALQGP